MFFRHHASLNGLHDTLATEYVAVCSGDRVVTAWNLPEDVDNRRFHPTWAVFVDRAPMLGPNLMVQMSRDPVGREIID